MKNTIDQLTEAVLLSDDRRRPGRVQRIVWLAEHERLPSAMIGRTETLHLLREAREIFVDGHFAAALMLAISVINHSLIEELQLRKAVQGDPGLQQVLTKSEQLCILPAEWFGPIRQLVNRRHPFVHLKEPDHEHALGQRVAEAKAPHKELLEQDARSAIMFMFQVFRATLRETAY